MAEASCSGSTPFKRLVDHQSRNASHPQDRLVDRSRLEESASFRSAPRHAMPGQQSFGAFMDGPPSVNSAHLGFSPDPSGRVAIHANAMQTPPTMPEFAHARASPAPDMRGWAADFSRFSSQQQMRQSAAPPAVHPVLQQQPPLAMLNFESAFGQPRPNFAPLLGRGAATSAASLEPGFDQDVARWMASYGGANMSQVDAAMDQMARELEMNESALPETATAEGESGFHAAQDEVVACHFTDLETPEIDRLTLQEPATDSEAPLDAQRAPVLAQAEAQSSDDAAALEKSALSEAAERLLESVQHESGHKWQESTFLSLMRDFRDGRKDIVENEIRQTDHHPGDEAPDEHALT